MKWVDKGHEFDEAFSSYSKVLKSKKKISIFGCGEVGNFYSDALIKMGVFGKFYDTKKNGEFKGYKISSIRDYDEGELLVLCASKKNIEEMKEILEDHSLTENDDFVSYDIFFSIVFPLLMLYERDILYSDMVQLSMTERCILKCKKCAHACNLVSINDEDMSYVDIKRSIDNYFKCVDFVQYFLLIGGEPLLNKNLDETVQYLGKTYRDRVGRLQISTNGLVRPSENLLETCHKYDVFFHVSNYAKTIPNVSGKLNEFINCLVEWNINHYLVSDEIEWTDYGFDYLDRGWKNLVPVFDSCKTECHEIRFDKLYYCIMARSVSENAKKGVGKDDYIKIVDEEGQALVSKKVLYEYLHGFSDKGYLDMCNYCYGSERQNHPIPVAEQE